MTELRYIVTKRSCQLEHESCMFKCTLFIDQSLESCTSELQYIHDTQYMSRNKD